MFFSHFISRGIETVGRYKKSEAEVLDLFQELDATKNYLHFQCKSVYEYSMKYYGFTEAVTLNFTAVSRRAGQVPELKAAIKTGKLTV
jgi:hypothetical protein